MLVSFFLVFCLVVAGACASAWWYYTTAMVKAEGAFVRVHALAGVSYQRRDSANRTAPSKPCAIPPITESCQPLSENDRVLAVPQAGYGPVASVLLPDRTHIQLWAYPTGADLTMRKFQVSRWSHQRQEVEFAQSAGYVRYDIPSGEGQAYADMRYTVVISNDIRLTLAPGGSYSIEVPQKDARLPRLSSTGAPLLAEIAVRDGSAEIGGSASGQALVPGQKAQIDDTGAVSGPLPAEWNLIRDGNFERYMTGAPADGISTWATHGFDFDLTVSDAECAAAQMTIYRTCHPTTPSAFLCPRQQTVFLAQFERQGNQSKSYGYGIEQTLDLDISEYRSLRFAMWARVISQSVPDAGVTNNECPVTVRFRFKRDGPADAPEERYICFYRSSFNKPIAPAGQYVYQAVSNQALWFRLEFDLRDPTFDLLKSARYIDSIAIYGNGHDYISQVTDISLIARQQR